MKRVGLVGVGNVALNGHLPGWLAREDVRVVAATDAREDGRAPLAARVPGVRWYSSFLEMVSSETLDFVDIATPPSTHAALATAALGRGLHVLCEKPLVTKADDVDGLAVLAKEKNRALVTVHNWIHAAPLAKLTELVRADAFGRVLNVDWQTIRQEPSVARGEQGNWRLDPAIAGGGILVDHGWHAFYVLHRWLGVPRTVSAKLETRKYKDLAVEDTTTVRLGYGSGAEATIFLTWAGEERRNSVKVVGSRATAKLDGRELIFLEGESAAPERSDGPVHEAAAVFHSQKNVFSFPEALTEGSHHPDWFVGVIEEFFAEMDSPAKRGTNLREAALCFSLIHLSKKSSERGGEVLAVEAPLEAHDL